MFNRSEIYYVLKVHDGLTRKKRNTLENPTKIRNIQPFIVCTESLRPLDWIEVRKLPTIAIIMQ